MLLTVDHILVPGPAGEKPMRVTTDAAEPLSPFPVGTGLKIENYSCPSVERGLSELNKLKVETLIKSERMWSP